MAYLVAVGLIHVYAWNSVNLINADEEICPG